jgi:hypothetical protein
MPFGRTTAAVIRSIRDAKKMRLFIVYLLQIVLPRSQVAGFSCGRLKQSIALWGVFLEFRFVRTGISVGVKVNHGSNPGVQSFLHCLIRILDSESGFKLHGHSQPGVRFCFRKRRLIQRVEADA